MKCIYTVVMTFTDVDVYTDISYTYDIPLFTFATQKNAAETAEKINESIRKNQLTEELSVKVLESFDIEEK